MIYTGHRCAARQHNRRLRCDRGGEIWIKDAKHYCFRHAPDGAMLDPDPGIRFTVAATKFPEVQRAWMKGENT